MLQHHIANEGRLHAPERFRQIDEVERLNTREEVREVRVRQLLITADDTEVAFVVRDKREANAGGGFVASALCIGLDNDGVGRSVFAAVERCFLLHSTLSRAKLHAVARLQTGRRSEQLLNPVQSRSRGTADNRDLVIDVVKMREDDVHLPLVAPDLVNRVLHQTDVRREALGALLRNALTVPSELVEHNARHDQLDQLQPDHFLDDADDSHLFRVFRDVKPDARVDQNLEHGAHSILSPSTARPAEFR